MPLKISARFVWTGQAQKFRFLKKKLSLSVRSLWFHWSKCTVECSIHLTVILKSAQARCAYGTEILYILVFLQIVCGHAELFFFFLQDSLFCWKCYWKTFPFWHQNMRSFGRNQPWWRPDQCIEIFTKGMAIPDVEF